MVVGISHIGLSTRDMAGSIRFYTEILGGRIIMEVEEPKGTPWIVNVQFEDGSSIELFYPRPEKFPLGTELGRNHPAFRVDDIHALERRLVSYGVPITSPARIVRDGNWQLWCTDPNGYSVEFMEYVPDCPQLKRGEKVILY